MKINNKFLPYILISPAIILIILFKFLPIMSTVKDSFIYDGIISLENYIALFKNKFFIQSLITTLKFNFIMTPIQIIISIALALVVNSKIKYISIFRTLIYLPVTISMTVAAVIWSIMLNPNNGVLNGFLGLFGVPQQGFLTDTKQALFVIMVICTWKGVAYWMMFLLAGLQNIDKEIYESALIDGANYIKALIYIIIPLLKRVLLFVIVADTIVNLLIFAPIQLLTRGGPQSSTNVLMYEAYKSVFIFADHSKSAAIVTILLLITTIVVFIQFIVLRAEH